MRSVLDKSGISQVKSMVTPGSNESAPSAVTAAGGMDEMILSSSEHHDITFATGEVMREASSPTLEKFANFFDNRKIVFESNATSVPMETKRACEKIW